MTIAVRSIATAGVNPTTSFTVTIGPCEANDLVVVNATSTNHSASDATATITDTDSGGNSYDLIKADASKKAYAWYKRATSATSGKVITVAGCKSASAGGATVYSGVLSSGTPYTNQGYEDNASGNETHAGFTPTNADSMLHFSVHPFSSSSTVVSVACTTPGALTQRFEHRSTAGSQGGATCTAWSVAQSGGPTATGNFTWSQSNCATKSIVFALIPEPASTTSDTQNPQHTYANAGTYTVSLTVVDDHALSSLSTAAVTVL